MDDIDIGVVVEIGGTGTPAPPAVIDGFYRGIFEHTSAQIAIQSVAESDAYRSR